MHGEAAYENLHLLYVYGLVCLIVLAVAGIKKFYQWRQRLAREQKLRYSPQASARGGGGIVM